MGNSFIAAVHKRGRVKHAARALILTAILAFALYTAIKAFGAAFDNDDFPESLAIKVQLMPLIFPVHMVTGALALLLIPLTYALRDRRRWHRLVGRIAATDVLLSGVTAFPVAWMAPVTTLSAAGFSAQATVWLGLLALGVHNIRRGRIAAHRACMILMAATTSGAIFFRIFLALWAIFAHGKHFELFYACDAWFAWLLPLTVCLSIQYWRQNKDARLPPTARH